jgi:hypothetical protein
MGACYQDRLAVGRGMPVKLHTRALSSLFVAFYDSQGNDGNIVTSLHTGHYWATLFLGDINTGTWPSMLEESQIWSWVLQDSRSDITKKLVVGPRWVPHTDIDWPTDHTITNFNPLKCYLYLVGVLQICTLRFIASFVTKPPAGVQPWSWWHQTLNSEWSNVWTSHFLLQCYNSFRNKRKKSSLYN